MNKVILMGRLTRDPDVRYTQGENPMCIARYTLAVDRRMSRNNQDGQTADFIGCVAFGRSGEFAEKYCHKGTKLAVTGRIQTGSYTNKEGQKVYTTDVVVEDQEFAESKSAQSQNNYGSSYGGDSFGQSSGNNNSNAQPSAAGDGFMNIPDGIDEELPFS
ncbi:single-stranded DNA-binding protein [Lachnoclostridium sp. Marseille-P6806]|uniref:single-stranded DNA-binding protein n=1 Tax=Lachnoclostridium sp. Marseille-P6806 TaxID=2364793 RepID=UPI0010317CCE|nr:single-stranded DNA-binding protein [Lachnoclostridium sp. Marseille-P6806]